VNPRSRCCLVHLVLFLLTCVLSGCLVVGGRFSPSELRGEIVVGDFGQLILFKPARYMPGYRDTVLVDSLASYPSWSPDGKRVVIATWRVPHHAGRLVIYERETDSLWELVPTDTLEYDFPAWSPDGSKIAFLGMEPASFEPEPEPSYPKVVRWVWALSKLPEKSKKTYYRNPAFLPTRGRLYVADNADGVPVEVTDTVALPGRPSWSPDSKEIMFATIDSQIVTVDISGKLTRRLGHGVVPAWSPDGTRMAFYRKGGVYIKDIDGKSLRCVIRRERVDSYVFYCGPSWPNTGGLTWSPDGEYLAYIGANRFQRLYAESATIVAVRLRDFTTRQIYYHHRIPRGCSWTM
jgi:Tol biopolymer transport system component